jgi:hypothetical protein
LYWQEYALMSSDEIGQILAGSGSTRGWAEIVDGRIEALGEQITKMEAAREFLVHVASHHDSSPDGCPHFEAEIWERRLSQRSGAVRWIPSRFARSQESPACIGKSPSAI